MERKGPSCTTLCSLGRRLLSWWQRDRNAAHHSIDGRHSRDGDQDVQQMLNLISEGEHGRAARLLSSAGVADLTDAYVVDQLRRKQPNRKISVDHGEFCRLQVDLQTTFRHLGCHAGTGISGFRNEYLLGVACDFANPRAQTVIPLFERFAEAYVNADLPFWFYSTVVSVKEVALTKELGANGDAAPDMRPIDIGECLRRAIHSNSACFKPASLATKGGGRCFRWSLHVGARCSLVSRTCAQPGCFYAGAAQCIR